MPEGVGATIIAVGHRRHKIIALKILLQISEPILRGSHVGCTNHLKNNHD